MSDIASPQCTPAHARLFITSAQYFSFIFKNYTQKTKIIILVMSVSLGVALFDGRLPLLVVGRGGIGSRFTAAIAP